MSWIGGEFAIQWQNAISPNVTTRRKALSFWTHNRYKLPGPIIFQLDAVQLLRGEWQRIVRHSESYCDCGQIRWILPSHVQQFHPPEQLQLVTLGPGRPHLSVTCWGGTTQTTIVQLSASDNKLHMWVRPFDNLTQAQRLARGIGAASDIARTPTSSLQTPSSSPLLTQLVQDLADRPYVGIPCDIGLGVDVTTHRRLVCRFMPCAIYGIDLQHSTVTVAVGRNCYTTNPADRATFHQCA